MSVKSDVKTGKFRVDIYPNGRKGKRIVRLFSTAEDAYEFERDSLLKAKRGFDISTQSEKLSDLVHLWFKTHGQHLSSGQDRFNMMLNACEAMGNPLVNRFSKQIFINYRNKRLSVVSTNTINHELIYFRSMFTKLIELDLYHYPNPLLGLKQLKTYESELSFLSIEEIEVLLKALKSRRSLKAYYCSLICLSTGARWGESEKIDNSKIRVHQLNFSKTKNTKVRRVPISDWLESDLKSFLKTEGSLSGAYSTFKVVFHELGFDVPKGQLTHILRHTFASHFMMNGGNILTLQKILGHSDIKMTMRYAHLSPDFLADSIRFNPLASLAVDEITTL